MCEHKRRYLYRRIPGVKVYQKAIQISFTLWLAKNFTDKAEFLSDLRVVPIRETFKCTEERLDRASFLAGAYHTRMRQCYIPSSLRGQPPHWVIDRGERRGTINRARWRTRD